MYRATGNSKVLAVESSRVVSESEVTDWLLDYASTHVTATDHVHWDDICGMAQAMATNSLQIQRLSDIKEQRRSGAAVEMTLEHEELAGDETREKDKKEAKKRKKEEKKAKKEAKRAKKEAKKKKKEIKQEA